MPKDRELRRLVPEFLIRGSSPASSRILPLGTTSSAYLRPNLTQHKTRQSWKVFKNFIIEKFRQHDMSQKLKSISGSCDCNSFMSTSACHATASSLFLSSSMQVINTRTNCHMDEEHVVRIILDQPMVLNKNAHAQYMEACGEQETSVKTLLRPQHTANGCVLGILSKMSPCIFITKDRG